MLFIWQRGDVKKKKKKKRGGDNILKKKKKKGSNIGSCPQVPVGETGLITNTWCKYSKLSRPYKGGYGQVYISGWHVPIMIDVWTKYGEPKLYCNGETGLITKTWCKYSKVSRPYKGGHGQVIYLVDMYQPWSMCGPNMVSLGYMIMEKLV
jgi:hypothetical protein